MLQFWSPIEQSKESTVHFLIALKEFWLEMFIPASLEVVLSMNNLFNKNISQYLNQI